MKRVSLLVTDKQHVILKKKAIEMEVSISEQIRRAVSMYLKKEREEAENERK